jgi:hypothetical protein
LAQAEAAAVLVLAIVHPMEFKVIILCFCLSLLLVVVTEQGLEIMVLPLAVLVALVAGQVVALVLSLAEPLLQQVKEMQAEALLPVLIIVEAAVAVRVRLAKQHHHSM